jgi:hypothetical protein
MEDGRVQGSEPIGGHGLEKYEWIEARRDDPRFKRLPRLMCNRNEVEFQMYGPETEGRWYISTDAEMEGIFRSQKNLNLFLCVPCDEYLQRASTIRTITTHGTAVQHRRAMTSVADPDTAVRRVCEELMGIIDQAQALTVLDNRFVQERW